MEEGLLVPLSDEPHPDPLLSRLLDPEAPHPEDDPKSELGVKSVPHPPSLGLTEPPGVVAAKPLQPLPLSGTPRDHPPSLTETTVPVTPNPVEVEEGRFGFMAAAIDEAAALCFDRWRCWWLEV
jgi:hypothetical protein